MFDYPDDSRVWGADVSVYQDINTTPKGMDFMKLKEEGASFVFIRAGQGSWIDPDFITNWLAAKEAGLPRAPYWLLDARMSGMSQALLFRKLMVEYGWGEMPPVVDYEHAVGVPTRIGKGRTISRMTYNTPEQLNAFIVNMGLPSPLRPMIYTNYYYWMEHGSPQSIWASHDLWVASYRPIPQIPPPWSTYIFHQFTAHGPGKILGAESENIDLDYYNGTAMQFDEYLKRYSPASEDNPQFAERNLVLDEVIDAVRQMKE